MTIEGIKRITTNGEGTEIEYKKSQSGLARSVYESICAFLNRRGGHVVLGADDDGTIVGIDPDKVQEQLDTLAGDTEEATLLETEKSTKRVSDEKLQKNVGHVSEMKMTERQRDILSLIKMSPTVSARQMSETLSVSQRSIERDIAMLKKQGILLRVGKDNNGFWRILEQKQDEK